MRTLREEIIHNRILECNYSDISKIISRLEVLFNEKGIIISDKVKKCCDCGEIKPIAEFPGRPHITNTNRCQKCFDINYSYMYLKQNLINYLIKNEKYNFSTAENMAERVIHPDHIKLKAMFIQINRKITNLKIKKYDASKH